MIEYRKGSVFDAVGPNTILVHACNCQGVWGSGIAPEFKKRWPKAFDEYALECFVMGNKSLGSCTIFTDTNQKIGCLFTSDNYGNKKDSEQSILSHTFLAVQDLLLLIEDSELEVHSPKINSGKFAVPWEKTEAIINEELKQFPNVKWIVWELE